MNLFLNDEIESVDKNLKSINIFKVKKNLLYFDKENTK